MKRIIKWALAAAVTLLVVGGVLLFTLDFGFLRGTVESRVSAALGRDVSIRGNLSIRLGTALVVEAEGLELANPAWADGPTFASVGQLRAVLETRSLWRGPLVVRQAEISGVNAALERNDEGQANWVMAMAGDAAAPAADRAAVLVESLRLENAQISLDSPGLDRPVTAVIERLEQRLDGDRLTAGLRGQLNERPVTLDLETGPYAHLVSGADVEIHAAGALGQVKLELTGRLDNAWKPERPTVALGLNGPDFAEFARMLGIEGLGGGDIGLQADTRIVDDALVVTIKGNLGEFVVDFGSRAGSLADFADAAVDARVSGPNFGRIARLAGLQGWPEEAFDLTARLQRPDGGLQVERFDLFLAGAKISLTGSMPAFPEPDGAELELRMQGPDLAPFADVIGLDETLPGAFSIDGDLSSSGTTTDLDLRFRTPLASGSVAGVLGAGESLLGTKLGVAAEGPNAMALGQLLELPGLAKAPWTYRMQYAVEDPAFFTVRDTRFATDGFSLDLHGNIGAESIEEHTDLRFDLRLGRLSDFQALAGDTGTLPEQPFTLSGQARSGSGAWALTGVTGSLGSGTFAVDGRLGSGTARAGTDLRVSFSGKRLADFQDIAGEAITLPEQDFSVDGRVASADGGWQLTGLQGQAGTTRFRIDGKLGAGASLAGTSLSLEASGTDLGAMFDIPGQARLPDGPFTGRTAIGLDAGRLRIDRAELGAGSFRLALDADVPWPFDMSNGRFSLNASGVNITRVLPELAGLELDEGAYEVRARGHWADGTIRLDKSEARIGATALTVNGALDLPPDLAATDLRIELRSPDLSQLGTVDGARWGRVPLDASAGFSGTASRIRMDRFQARLGDSDIRGTFEMDFSGDIPEFGLQLTTTALNLRPFQTGPDEPAAEDQPAGDQRIIPETAFPMPALASANGNFSVVADRVLLKRVTLENNTLTGSLRGGTLRISELGTDGYRGRLVATLDLAPHGEHGARLVTTVQSSGLVIDFSEQPAEYKDELPPFDIDVRLEGVGPTVRAAAATLNGTIKASSPGGIVRNIAAGAARNPLLAQVVSAISPSASRQDQITISCVAATIGARDGVLLLDPGVAIQSDKLNIFARGKVSLVNEKLDINLRTQTRKTVDISVSEVFSPYVKLAGTLGKPSVAIDPKGTLLSGGAAYLSGGLSILAKKALDQLGGTGDPCASLLEAAPAADQP